MSVLVLLEIESLSKINNAIPFIKRIELPSVDFWSVFVMVLSMTGFPIVNYILLIAIKRRRNDFGKNRTGWTLRKNKKEKGDKKVLVRR